MNILGKIFIFNAFLTLMLATQADRIPGVVGIFVITSVLLFMFWVFVKEEDNEERKI